MTCAKVTLFGVQAAESCGPLTRVAVEGINENPVKAADRAYDGVSCFLASTGDFGNGEQSLAVPILLHYRDGVGTNYYASFLSVAELYVTPTVNGRARVTRLRLVALPVPGGSAIGSPDVFFYDESIDGVPRYTGDPLPNNAIVDPCVFSAFDVFSDGTATVEIENNCFEQTDALILVACDGSGDEIAVDPRTQTGISALYKNRLWKPDRLGSGDPVVVDWVDQHCPDTQANKLATKCRGIGEIGLDPASIPTSARTCIYEGERYAVTSIDTTLDAVPVVYSNKTCSGIVLPDCTEIVDHTDPRCSDPRWRSCPNCGSAGGRPIGDPVRPGDLIIAPDDDGGGGDLPGLGDVVKHAIEFLHLDKLANPDRCGCERRRLILNRYGGAYGRAIAKRLGL